MPLITIRQTGNWDESPNAVVSFDKRGERPVTVTDPFSPEEEQNMEWYFEEHLKFPFTKQVQAKTAARSITRYGELLFEQVFKSQVEIYGSYKQARQQGVNKLCFEILGSPEFHHLHWEALKDPEWPTPFVMDAPMVRRTPQPPADLPTLQTASLIRLLLVVARPSGRQDMGFRTISRPLVEGLRNARTPVQVDIVRPGAYQALVEQLTRVSDQHGSGYYHLIHFDLHGALLTHDQFQKGIQPGGYTYQSRFGRDDIAPYEGHKAFLAFEGEEAGQSDLAEAGEIADLLLKHQIPLAILNACQSGKQVGAQETSLASRLLQAGVQTVLAMGYSVTVSAAALMMQTLYRQLFQQQDLSAAIRHARLALFNQKARRAYYNVQIDLEDWALPVVYQSGDEMKLPLRAMSFEEEDEFYAQQEQRYRAPEPEYGFVGRDMDILQIEKRVLAKSEGKQRNLLLIRGMGGAGKTTLLHHVGEWWQTTRFVNDVFYFGYDEKAWHLEEVLFKIAQKVFGAEDGRPSVEFRKWQALQDNAKQSRLVRFLRSERHLLILDNLESITGAHLAIQHTLPEKERESLRRFLFDLSGGSTLVLLGSRGGEDWLVQGSNAPLRENDIYDLPGLDDEAASTLAERILERHVSDSEQRAAYRESQEFRRLLKLLDGYPLPLEVVLANLSRQSPQAVLEALQAGDVDLDAKDAQSKTESILKCIDYSHSNLSEDAQKLLLCLAPFTGVINLQFLEQYTQQLQQQPELTDLPFDRWQEVLQEAANWGLLTPHEVQGFLHLQPIFPYFLRSRLQEPHPAHPQRGGSSPLSFGEGSGERSSSLRTAIETAFRLFYDGIGGLLGNLLTSKEPRERQMGQLLSRLEYENLHTALNLALDAQEPFYNFYNALHSYLEFTQEHQRGLQLDQSILTQMGKSSPEALTGELGFNFGIVLDHAATRYLKIKQYDNAQAAYQKCLELLPNLKILDQKTKANLRASTYHQLGRVAQEQRQWAQAEQSYQQALALKIEFNDRYGQAGTYHQLGIVAQEQRQWAQAELYYQQALALKIEFNDRYSQASTYHQLGRVAEEQEQWQQAELYYQQALALKIEFNDRYSQASTYHQLGRVAEKQEQWQQAQEYFLKALEIFVEFNDEHSLGVVRRSLVRLFNESGDAELPAAVVAGILGITPQEAQELLQSDKEE